MRVYLLQYKERGNIALSTLWSSASILGPKIPNAKFHFDRLQKERFPYSTSVCLRSTDRPWTSCGHFRKNFVLGQLAPGNWIFSYSTLLYLCNFPLTLAICEPWTGSLLRRRNTLYSLGYNLLIDFMVDIVLYGFWMGTRWWTISNLSFSTLQAWWNYSWGMYIFHFYALHVWTCRLCGFGSWYNEYNPQTNKVLFPVHFRKTHNIHVMEKSRFCTYKSSIRLRDETDEKWR